MTDTDKVKRKTLDELAAVSDQQLLKVLRSVLLSEPEYHEREWDYSATRTLYRCWYVAKFPEIDTAIVYSEHGHACPWGIVELSENWFGRDDSWCMTLEEAFRRSGAYIEPMSH